MTTPTELADRFKRSGAFDQARKALLQEFLHPESEQKALLDAQLHAVLSPILQQPAFASKTRKQSIETLQRAVDKNALLHKTSLKVEANLRSSDPDLVACGKGLGDRIQAELAETLRISRGEAPRQSS